MIHHFKVLLCLLLAVCNQQIQAQNNLYGNWQLIDIFSTEKNEVVDANLGIGSIIKIDSNYVYTLLGTPLLIKDSLLSKTKFHFDNSKNILTEQQNQYAIKWVTRNSFFVLNDNIGMLLKKENHQTKNENIFYGKLVNDEDDAVHPANIQVSNGINLQTDSLGFFYFSDKDTSTQILISNVGYTTKKANLTANKFQYIELERDKQMLQTVTVKNNAGIVLNDFKKKPSHFYAVSLPNAKIATKFFPFANHKKLKAVKIGTDGRNSTMNLVVYSADEKSGLPDKVLVKQMVAISNKVELIQLPQKIKIEGPSFFISLEWIDNIENARWERQKYDGKKEIVKYINPCIRFKKEGELADESEVWMMLNKKTWFCSKSMQPLQISAVME